MYELRLFASKTYTNFVTMNPFYLIFSLKQMFRPIDRQTSNCNTINNSINTKMRPFQQKNNL